MRPTDKELATMLRVAAKMIDRLAPKDIFKSFSEKIFSQNTLRKAANALDDQSTVPLDRENRKCATR